MSLHSFFHLPARELATRLLATSFPTSVNHRGCVVFATEGNYSTDKFPVLFNYLFFSKKKKKQNQLNIEINVSSWKKKQIKFPPVCISQSITEIKSHWQTTNYKSKKKTITKIAIYNQSSNDLSFTTFNLEQKISQVKDTFETKKIKIQ